MTTTFRRARSGLYIPRTAATYDSRVLSDLAPAVAYRFDDGPAGAAATGAQMTDYSGNAQHGTYINGPTLSGGAAGVAFNGTNQYATMPTTLLPVGNSAYTIETVVNVSSLGHTVEMVSYGANLTKQMNGFEVETSGEFSNWWSGANVTTSGHALSTGTWYCLTCTYNGSSTVILYLNGTQVASGAMSSHNGNSTTGWVCRNVTNNGSYFSGTYRRLSISATCDTSANIAARAALAPLT